MNIVELSINELIPYENNPRKNDEAVQYVANSIKEFGFKVPIVIDKDYVIVAGHTRYKASKQLGLEKVPCIIADDLTDEQIKAFRLADNKTGELADWDFDLLDSELFDIQDIDMDLFGFNKDITIGEEFGSEIEYSDSEKTKFVVEVEFENEDEAVEYLHTCEEQGYHANLK